MTSNNPDLVETPSGKDAAYENFPVSPLVLPKKTRRHVACFYNFARAIDDIADNPALSAEEKINRLSGFEAALQGDNTDDRAFDTGHAMKASLQETSVPSQHCLDLISAFKQDAVKNRYADWAELMDYCDRSAAPVGRYLIDLHGGSNNGFGPSDALCNALQVINHLQDCQADYREMDRVYLPQNWMAGEGVRDEDLNASASNHGLRAVMDLCLDETERLLSDARLLPKGVHSRGLGLMSAAIVDIAETLVVRLHDQDPLARRVALKKPHYLWCCLRGGLRYLLMI